MNLTGTILKVSIFGESHGPSIGVMLDGIPSGTKIPHEKIKRFLEERNSALIGTTKRKEKDEYVIMSGVLDGCATGAPILISIPNSDTNSSTYSQFSTHWRPSHIDKVAQDKYPNTDLRGSGHFSGRLTAAICVAGAIASELHEISVMSTIYSIKGVKYDIMGQIHNVKNSINRGDSLGGKIITICENVQSGLGEPFFDSLESRISSLLFSIPGVKAIEFGDGVEFANSTGSESNDMWSNATRTSTNHHGGINGGISNGMPMVIKTTIRPPASISVKQSTYDSSTGKVSPLSISGRHDTCIALRIPIVITAMLHLALADFTLIRKTQT